MKLTNLIAASALVLAISGSALAAGGHHAKGAEIIPKRAMKQLSLTDQQKDQVKAIIEAAKQQFDGEKGTRKQARQQLEALTNTSASFDETKARELIAQQQQAHMERQIAHLKAKHDIWNILTDEQKAKLEELKENHKERMQEKRERRGERR